MKRILLLALLLAIFPALFAQQLDTTGASSVHFSIDGDTRNNYQKITTLTPLQYSHLDDWFLQDGYKRYDAGGTGLGNSIFDTIGTATYKAQLMANQNISFIKRMKYPNFDVLPMWKSPYGPYDPDPAKKGFDSSFWVDGIYFRDYAGGTDITSFSGGKNGDNPNTWSIGGSVSNKTDIVDVMTHVRTSGLNPITDSVWFFAGVSTVQTTGNRFFDIEVYREPFSYDETTKKFTSAGAISGHSAWTFDATGKVTRSGDLIISVSYQSGRLPEIDFRIFIAKSTYDSVVAGRLNPTTFRIATGSTQWNLNSEGTGGYAQILAKSGATNWGSGLANYVATNTAAQDAVQGPPWGTLNSSGVWSENYDRLQFIEISLNFSRFGMNPFHYVTSYCSSPYSSIIVKSRASTSFNANLEDFVIPQSFSVKEVAPYTVTPEIFSCSNTSPKLAWNFSARNYYRLLNSNGDTLAKDVDFRTATTAADRFLTVSQPGTYRVEATNFQGCPTMSSTTITVQADTTKPTAAALMGWGRPYYFLNGVGTGTGTEFGSPSLSYSWTGPAGATGFPSTDEDPFLANTQEAVVMGDYYLTVTQGRNGCSATSMINVNPIVLANDAITLQGKLVNGKARLNWNTADITQASAFEIERSSNGIQFVKVGHITGAIGTRQYSFTDNQPLSGHVQYRVKSISGGASPSTYSNTISLQTGNTEGVVMTRQLLANRVNIHLKQLADKDLVIKVMAMDGRLLLQQTYPGSQVRTTGTSIKLQLPASVSNQAVVVAAYQDGYLLEARKL